MSEREKARDSFGALGQIKIGSLIELDAFLRHRSTLAVSRELGITQSALSKHLSKLEGDLGFPLFEHNHKLVFTPAGRRFASYASATLENFFCCVQECAELDAGEVKTLRIESNDMYFAGQERFYRVLNRFMTLHDECNYVITSKRAKNAKSALREDLVDFSLWYDFDDIDQAVKKAAKEGWGLVHLSSEHLMVWANKNHRIFSLKKITAADIGRERVMVASPYSFRDTSSIVDQLFQTKAYELYTPKRDVRLCDNRAKFLMADPAGSIYLLPESFGNVPQVYERTSMKSRLIEDDSTLHHMFLMFDLKARNECVIEFAEYLKAEL